MLTFFDILFILLAGVLLLVAVTQRIGIAVTLYIANYVAFMLVAHLAWRLGAGPGYDQSIYLTAHIVSFVFLIGVALVGREPGTDQFVYRGVSNLSQLSLTVILLAYLTFNFYLLARYGSIGSVRLVGGESIVIRGPLDEALSQLLTALGTGAAMAVVIQLAIEPQSMRKLGTMLSFGTFMVLNLGFGTASAGGRRTVLVLAVAFVLAKIGASGRDVLVMARRNAKALTFAGVACLLLAGYYQEVRANAHLTDVRVRLASEDTSVWAEGVLMLLTPGLSHAYGAEADAAMINRSGPFDFLVAIVDGSLWQGRSTRGEATWHAVEMNVPRVFHSDKPTHDTDHIIGNYFLVKPGGSGWVSGATLERGEDYSTTVLATLFADFGWLGLLLAVAVVAMSARIATRVFLLMPHNPIVAMGALGAMFDLAGQVEGSLVGLIGIFKLLILFVIIGAAIELFRSRPQSRRAAPQTDLRRSERR